MTQERKIKVLLSKLGVDVHWRGVVTVARMLRDAGMEVVYIGNANPPEIIEAAIQEGVDVVGVSSLCGAELSLGSELIDLAKQKGLTDNSLLLIGGVFPHSHTLKLKEFGFDGVFEPGATRDEIVSLIKNAIEGKEAVK
jgi:methylmalonyl-CoA mutase C-terminal domain/subunit